MHPPIEGQHVVLAEAVELDVLHDDHLRAVLIEDALTDDVFEALLGPLCQLFEGLGDDSQLKTFLQERWRNSETSLYQQSRERLPVPPWDRYFGLIQDYHPEEKGLFYQGLLVDQEKAS